MRRPRLMAQYTPASALRASAFRYCALRPHARVHQESFNAQASHPHARRTFVQQQRRRLQSRNGGARRARRRDLRVPDHRGGLHRRGQGRRCGLCQGHEVQPGDDRGARQVPRHRARQRRRRLCRRGGRDREGHSGHQLPRHLHRGGGGPRHDAAAGDAPPRDRAGPHGARGPLDRRAAAAPAGSAPDGTDARVHRVRPGRARGGAAGKAVRAAPDGARSVPRRARHLRAWRRTRRPVRAVESVGFHLDAPAGYARGGRLPQGAPFPPDEEDRDLHQYRAWTDGGGIRH